MYSTDLKIDPSFFLYWLDFLNKNISCLNIPLGVNHPVCQKVNKKKKCINEGLSYIYLNLFYHDVRFLNIDNWR